MPNYETLPEVTQFFDEAKNVNSYNDEKIFQLMEQHFQQFSFINANPNGYQLKLAFVSSILRNLNLTQISISQSFAPTIMGNLKETYNCQIIAESHNSEIISYRPKVMEAWNTMKKEREEQALIQNEEDIPQEEKFRFNTIWQQKDKIKELFVNVLNQFNNDYIASVAISAFLIFEMESMSIYQAKKTIFYSDLYDLLNPFDKWFSAVTINAEIIKPLVLFKSTRIH